jgi:hypothetical protein
VKGHRIKYLVAIQKHTKERYAKATDMFLKKQFEKKSKQESVPIPNKPYYYMILS